MKMKKVIGMLIITLMLALAICTAIPTKTYAAADSYPLVITDLRKNGHSYAIKFNDGTSEARDITKIIWKIAIRNGDKIDTSNAFYCLRAEHGMGGFTNASLGMEPINYNKKLDMKTQSGEVLALLNQISTVSQETYNKIMWIIDNMYIPTEGEQARNNLIKKATGYDTSPLNDDEVEAIQQLAIWYFTNSDMDYYNNATLPDIYTNEYENEHITDDQYKTLNDVYGSMDKQDDGTALFNYFITNARGDYNYMSTATPPITFTNGSNNVAEQVGERYVMGPFNITIDATKQYNVSELVFKDQNGQQITLTGDNQLLDANKQVVNSGNLNDVIGQNFYISLPVGTTITQVNFSLKGTYPTTTATYYTTEVSPERQQPVVLVEKANPEITGTASITIPAARNLDLALRKSITKLNNVETTGRIPQVDATNLANGTATTATYNHTKEDLTTEKDQLIEYTMNVYNEGQKDGYALEIKDYLPAGIEFVELVSPTDKYTASATKNNDGTSVVTITNTGKNILGKYTTGTPNSEAVTIRCKVTQEAGTTSKRLVNVAEITKYFDSESNLEKTADKDSQISNFPNNLKNNPTYKGNGTEGNYTKGQQDDDDFEAVVIPGKYFDLALRKFVSGINGKDLGTSRAPVPDVTNLANGTATTATYNQPKLPVSVKKGDIVTYTIRVYNEGQLDGYASEVTDHLPPQLEFLPDDKDNIENGWHYDENDATLRTIKTTHLSKDIDEENVIKAFNGITLDYIDITVKCKVKTTVTSGEKITNIADITGFTDKNGNEVPDRDSEKNNVVLPSDEDLPNYKDDEIESGKPYIPGQQDDDDFEKLQIQIFDLALRKFITAVDTESITNRIPVPTMGEDGNIKYTHTKDPVEVQTNDIITYTLRVFNEGDIAGYASEITDDLPEGLLYLPENEVNKTYSWKMIDAEGKETADITKAVKVTTDYLSKENEKTEGANLLKAFDRNAGITNTNPDFKDVKIAFKVTEPSTSDKILTNIAQISDDTDEDGNPIEDNDSVPGNDDMTEDDIDVEHVKLVYFDLALRKFITKVDNLDINNRYPKLTLDKDGKIKYTHTKDPVEVENGNIVTYTLRVYNEGKIAGYASEITDDLPKGLLYLPENEVNKEYSWKMIDSEGKETTDVEKAVKITTNYLSKENEKTEGANLLKAFNKAQGITDTNPDHRDVKIAFKITEPTTSDRILINTAEISDDTDKDGKPVDDIDSTPGNDKDGEDDIDIEKVKVKYFDLALKKWVTQAIVIEDGKQTVTNTGHTGDENPEPVVKVDLKSKKINKVTVKFAYKIKVTNEGQIEGYVKELKDYIPEGLKFVQSDNPEWKEISNGVVTTNKLQNTLLKPGESATVDILLTWINGNDNLGKKVNVAEISKDYNESHTPDIDSTPDNKKPGEDDIDDAPVILSVKTGEEPKYIALTTITLLTLAGGVYLIKKYVL